MTDCNVELKACPWCQSINIDYDEGQMFCRRCEAAGPRISFGEPLSAEERWNLRRISPCTDEDVERVARAICAAIAGDPDRLWTTFEPAARAAISAMNQIRSTDHE